MNLNRMNTVSIQSVAKLLSLAGVTALLLGGAHPIAVGLIAAPMDKVAHAATYAVLALLVGLASGYHGAKLLLTGFFAAIGIGIVDELLQLLSPGRHADLEDLLADGVGAVLGTLWLAVIVCRRNATRKHDHHLSND
jgi:VanZ family protein